MVRALGGQATNSLDLGGALEAEAHAPNSVMPPQPGLADLASSQRDRFAKWLANELRSGLNVSPRVVVNARKPRHGTRPAPILAIPERVAFRAIVKQILDEEEPLSRTPQDYADFVHGPVTHVMGKAQHSRTLGGLLDDDEIQYVIKSDLAAFYEYIDHGILGRMLAMRSPDIDLVQMLMEFVSDIEGRTYGLPQMFDASDWLSEIYAQLVQDQLSRRGFLVWRFNDDFRIGVPSFAAAIHGIEALSEEARSLGLVLNEYKTVTPKFINYAMTTLGLQSIDDEIPIDETSEVEAVVADYGERFGDPDDAVTLLHQAVNGDDNWDLGDVPPEKVALLRRAIWSVVRARDARALDVLVPIAIYLPSLTPALCRYAEAIAGDHLAGVAEPIDAVISNVSLGGWQRMWFNYLLRSTALMYEQGSGDTSPRIAFAEACMNDPRHPAARAEAVLALAPTGRLSVEVIADSLVTEPRALASWYVVAAAEATRTERDEKVLSGIRGSDPVYRMLLDARP